MGQKIKTKCLRIGKNRVCDSTLLAKKRFRQIFNWRF